MWQIGVVSPPGQEDKMLAEITGGTDWLILARKCGCARFSGTWNECSSSERLISGIFDPTLRPPGNYFLALALVDIENSWHVIQVVWRSSVWRPPASHRHCHSMLRLYGMLFTVFSHVNRHDYYRKLGLVQMPRAWHKALAPLGHAALRLYVSRYLCERRGCWGLVAKSWWPKTWVFYRRKLNIEKTTIDENRWMTMNVWIKHEHGNIMKYWNFLKECEESTMRMGGHCRQASLSTGWSWRDHLRHRV